MLELKACGCVSLEEAQEAKDKPRCILKYIVSAFGGRDPLIVVVGPSQGLPTSVLLVEPSPRLHHTEWGETGSLHEKWGS
ncbi:hypothetical protein ALC62_04370 [Cyphomyrmex costatus]|uniref:Uncharacterized protein n=1 Tax=Cyphomyrmex costatus TaxID=456900 RepID=A0A195CVS6_9HYME|nr:hypothetical protein ALC62_04370 [Cyphomyrmex costatus]